MRTIQLPAAYRVAVPDQRVHWMAGGLGACFPRIRTDGYLEILVGGRDDQGRSRIGALTYEWGQPPRLLSVSECLLDLGEAGCFDMDGCGYPWLVQVGDVQRVFYVGWMRLGGDVPFRNKLGLATRIGEDGPFSRWSRGGLFHATDAEPVGSGSCAVDHLTNGGWRMIYTNFEPWVRGRDGVNHRYHLRTAWSADGVTFDRDKAVVVEALRDGEVAIGTPAPRQVDGGEEILFAARRDKYSLYAARSGTDGRLASRTLVQVTPGDWDDEMQAYPRVLRVDGTDWLFYSGNGYGRAGIGMVRLLDQPLTVDDSA